PNEGGFHAMRAHDSHVTDDGLTEAVTGNPVTPSPSPATGPLASGHVPTARSHGRKAAGPGDAWCADLGDTDAVPDAAEARDAVRRPGRPRSERAEQAIIDA